MKQIESKWQVSALSRISEISEKEWDDCACSNTATKRVKDPFSTHRFLSALEFSGSATGGTGWDPLHLVASRNGEVAAVMPLYAKSHSQGEFVFDHSWANAFERAGGNYYPKLQSSIPFTPVTGRRLLTKNRLDTEGMRVLLSAAKQIAIQNGLSSLHITFCCEHEVAECLSEDLLHRTGEQFHWFNRNYVCFDDFLSDLSSRKRRNIKKERRKALQFGGRILQLTGDQIKPHHWDAFWNFYQDTGYRKWGFPYLKRDFFDIIHQTMLNDILLIMCEREGKYIAGALNFIGQDTLFGRYWGCTEQHSCLHFEVCYYQAIEFAIRSNLKYVEAGAQGMHKIARGYVPVVVHSLHWIANTAFRRGIEGFLREENELVKGEIDHLTEAGPFRKEKDIS